MGYSIAQWVFTVVINQILLSSFDFKHMELTYNFNVSCLVIGIIILVLEGIFKAGSALEEEQQLTI
jgi:hypothetical protein